MEMPGAQRYHERIEALKAMVNLIEVDEATFRLLLRSHEKPTIVSGETGMLWFKKFTYLTSYDGFVFCHRGAKACDFAADAPGALTIEAKAVHIPFL
jgi:hypothetical protein